MTDDTPTPDARPRERPLQYYVRRIVELEAENDALRGALADIATILGVAPVTGTMADAVQDVVDRRASLRTELVALRAQLAEVERERDAALSEMRRLTTLNEYLERRRAEPHD